MTTIDSFSCKDTQGREVGVEAHRLPDGAIAIATDSGDDAMTVLSPSDAAALAQWLADTPARVISGRSARNSNHETAPGAIERESGRC